MIIVLGFVGYFIIGVGVTFVIFKKAETDFSDISEDTFGSMVGSTLLWPLVIILGIGLLFGMALKKLVDEFENLFKKKEKSD